ncbi:hypothetical protein SAMN05421595_1399 [Austwickia chelonae]|nr:hypothetical protein SAMN05421595_1399 [Austwickia chelonae]
MYAWGGGEEARLDGREQTRTGYEDVRLHEKDIA